MSGRTGKKDFLWAVRSVTDIGGGNATAVLPRVWVPTCGRNDSPSRSSSPTSNLDARKVRCEVVSGETYPSMNWRETDAKVWTFDPDSRGGLSLSLLRHSNMCLVVLLTDQDNELVFKKDFV